MVLRQRRHNFCRCAHAWRCQKEWCLGSAGPISVVVRMRGEIRKDRVGRAGPISVNLCACADRSERMV